MAKEVVLFPKPKTVSYSGGKSSLFQGNLCCVLPDDLRIAEQALKPRLERWGIEVSSPALSSSQSVRFTKDPDLGSEAYRLSVSSEGIEVSYAAVAGGFYALVTLGQLLAQCSGELPCVDIRDAPDFPVRGVMLDISRDKVPTLETLFHIADMLADLKVNHFELYIEGFSFAYPSFTDLWKGETPLTGEEIQKLDAYCKARMIDLVPNQNCLGHMSSWIASPQYKHLAESDTGLELLGHKMPSSTLNPLDTGSIELIKKMTEDLLPNFTSSYFNVDMDEPFGLGTGKSKAEAERIGVGRLYVDYAKKIHQIVTGAGKKMLMWGDILIKHMKDAGDLPADIIVLDWGYDSGHPFAAHAKALQEAGCSFILCPGTSSWTSFTGRTDNMIANVREAAEAALEHRAMGLITTDWGDNGHLQYLPVSYAGYAVLASYSWNAREDCQKDLPVWLDRFVYHDPGEVMGSLSLEAGRYNQFEELLVPNMTLAGMLLSTGYVPGVSIDQLIGGWVKGIGELLSPETAAIYIKQFEDRKVFDFDGLMAFLKELREKIEKAELRCPDAALIKREYKNGIAMVEFTSRIHQLMNLRDRGASVEKLLRDADAIIAEHRFLWLARNKTGGLDHSTGFLLRLKSQL